MRFSGPLVLIPCPRIPDAPKNSIDIKLDFSILKIYVNVFKDSFNLPILRFGRSVVEVKAVTIPVPGKKANCLIRIVDQLVLAITGTPNKWRDK